MSSIQSSFAQKKSNTLTVLGSGTAYIHDLANITGSFVAGSVSNVGSLYTVDTVAHFLSFVGTLHGGGSGGNYNSLAANETLVDLGAELVVGVAGVSSTLLKFRLVRRTTGTVAATGFTSVPLAVGYVVVENNVSQDTESSINGKLNVKVARV